MPCVSGTFCAVDSTNFHHFVETTGWSEWGDTLPCEVRDETCWSDGWFEAIDLETVVVHSVPSAGTLAVKSW